MEKQYQVSIKITAEATKVQTLGGLLQNAVNVVATDDMIKLLSKVQQNPSIVKTALKFI